MSDNVSGHFWCAYFSSGSGVFFVYHMLCKIVLIYFFLCLTVFQCC